MVGLFSPRWSSIGSLLFVFSLSEMKMKMMMIIFIIIFIISKGSGAVFMLLPIFV